MTAKSAMGSFRIDPEITMCCSTKDIEDGKRGVLSGYISAVVTDNRGKKIRVVFPSVDIEIYSILGQIISRWSALDMIITEQVGLLIAYRNKTVTGWRKSEANKRIKLLEDEVGEIFCSSPVLLASYREAISIVRKCAKIRNLIAHAQMSGYVRDGKTAIKFIDQSISANTEKVFSQSELWHVASEISHVAGFLESLAVADPDFLHLSSQDISELQRVLGKDRWSRASAQALKLPRSAFSG